MRAIQLGAAFYIALLLLLCVFGRKDLAAIIQMGATVAGLCACGSGAAKVGMLLLLLSCSSQRNRATEASNTENSVVQLLRIFSSSPTSRGLGTAGGVRHGGEGVDSRQAQTN